MRAEMLLSAIVIAGSIAVALSGQTIPREIGLGDLTVPSSRLPAGCTLVAAPSERLDDNQARTGLWTGLNIRTNPWIGTDAPVLADIHERLDPPERPDGPPLSAKEATRYHLRLADGIDRGYAAIYRERDTPNLMVVYGLEFPSTEAAMSFATRARAASIAVVNGRVASFASGASSECLQTIRQYLNGLTR
jgi:hypothetical protein